MVATLPKLKELTLNALPRLRKMGLHIHEIPNLESISIEDCGEIEEIFEEDEGRDASILTGLQTLCLQGLPRLKSVSKTKIMSNSIATIWIKECPRLMNKLPVHFDGPTLPPYLRLGGIHVEREWWESLEWDLNMNPDLLDLLQFIAGFEDSGEEDSSPSPV